MVISSGDECGHWDYAVHVGCDLWSDEHVLLLKGLTYGIPFRLLSVAEIRQENGRPRLSVQNFIVILFHHLSSVSLLSLYIS